MTVYIEVIFLINLIFDFCLLATTDLLLKRHASFKRIFLGALLGEISMVTLFVSLSIFWMFVFKIGLSVIMCLSAFKYRDFKYTFYNVLYLYLVGIILGGFVYYLFNEFQINREYSFKYLLILFLSPIVLIIYYKLTMRFKNNYNNRHQLIFKYGSETFEGIGFLDSGNKLVSPISGKPIILVEKEYITLHKLKIIPVPYNALNHHGIVNCFKPDLVLVDGRETQNVLIGISEVKFNIDGCNALLNSKMEGI